MSNQLRRLQASSIDGRAQNARYAQNQLKRLFEALVEGKSSIKAALRSDTSYLPAEVEAEYYLTLANIREHYKSINIAKALEDEYSVANNKDCSLRRSPVGCVYIVPAQHTPLFSTIAPISAAIVAGNCVAVELKQTSSELNTLLRRVLTTALNTGTFVATDCKPVDDEFFSSYLTVQEAIGPNNVSPSLTQVVCPSSSRVVAAVDRTANIQNAAQHIVHARFSFKGRSPYAPDIVLVNEFALRDFCTAVSQKATVYFAGQVNETANGFVHKAPPKNDDNDELQKALTEEGVETIVSGSRGSVVLVKNRKSPLLHCKLTSPTILIHAVSSLDDAIDTSIASMTSSSPLLAIYLFANPTAAKYLSQFIPASLSCTNAIPPSLLLGPAYPSGFTPSISSADRFTSQMFSRPAPEFTAAQNSSHPLSQVLYGHGKGQEEICEESLPSTNQPEAKSIGFFEQGILTGMGVLATGIVGTVAVVGFVARKRLR